ncbi:MAG: DNA polymerase ligase N-terminal domain-containing protein [Planctomycetota bacterium]
MPRFAVLEHTGAPDDPAGLHYDLLLEQGPRCRTWRLATIPVPGGPDVVAIELSPHRLAWLDHEAGDVSGGRGFARRVDAGTYEPAAVADSEASRPVVVHITLHGERLSGGLVLSKRADHWLARLAGPHTS